MYEVVTYANKSQGYFDQLINNKYGIQVTVLGWGTKWNGFMDKIKGLLAYIENKPDNHIVVFLDGFDSIINKNPTNLIDLFESYNCNILVSKDTFEPNFISKFWYGNCKNNLVANSGMYMGYVKHLKMLLGKMITLKCNDDQVNFNNMCHNFDFIKVDEQELIFSNVNKKIYDSPIFVSFPGSFHINKIPVVFNMFFGMLYLFIILLLTTLTFIVPAHRFKWIGGIVISTLYYVFFLNNKNCLYKK